MKNIKNKSSLSILTLLFISVLCFGMALGMSFSNVSTVYADTEPQVVGQMVKGASISIKNDKIGIRFQSSLSKTDYESIKGEATSLDVVTTIQPVGKTVTPLEYKWTINDDDFNGKDEVVFAASLMYNITEGETNYLSPDKRKVAVAQEMQAWTVVKNGDQVVAEIKSAEDNNRSMRAVAVAAFKAGECTKEQLSNYLGEDKSEQSNNVLFEEKSPLNIPDTFDSAYIGARKVTGNEVLAEKTLGNNYDDMVIFDKDNNYSSVNYKYVTKAISQASDLNCISYSDDAKILTGYYILANNIDATGYNAVDHGWPVYENGLADQQLGFKGVFDGQGYTIKGMTVGTGGLFGRIIGEGRVINLGLTDVHYKEKVTTSAMACDVSCRATEDDSPATFENIYFQTDEIPTGKDEWGIVSASFVNEMYTDTKMVNCIFEVNGESETNGSLVAELYTDCMDQSYKDVYMISETPLLINKTSGAERICDANNITYDPSLESKNVFNIKRYATKDEMKEAGNDYSAFSTEYWDTTSGIPIWKTISE